MKLKMVTNDRAGDAVVDTKTGAFNFAENSNGGVVLTIRENRPFGRKFVVFYVPCETAIKTKFVERCFYAVKCNGRKTFDDLAELAVDVSIIDERLLFTANNGLKFKTTRMLNAEAGQDATPLLNRVVNSFRRSVYGNVK